MNAPDSKQTKVTKRNFATRVNSRGFTVRAFARHIHRSVPTLYLAMERPSRYPLAYALIQKELQ